MGISSLYGNTGSGLRRNDMKAGAPIVCHSRACSRVLKRAYLGRFTGSMCRLLCSFKERTQTERVCECAHSRVYGGEKGREGLSVAFYIADAIQNT